MAAKALEMAISRVNALPEAAQEQIGRELLARIEAIDALRADAQLGIDELDAGLGEELDIDGIIMQMRREHAK